MLPHTRQSGETTTSVLVSHRLMTMDRTKQKITCSHQLMFCIGKFPLKMVNERKSAGDSGCPSRVIRIMELKSCEICKISLSRPIITGKILALFRAPQIKILLFVFFFHTLIAQLITHIFKTVQRGAHVTCDIVLTQSSIILHNSDNSDF